MQRMDVDLDVPAFLNSEKQNVPSNLQHYYVDFEDLYDRKYVSDSLLDLLNLSTRPHALKFQTLASAYTKGFRVLE